MQLLITENPHLTACRPGVGLLHLAPDVANKSHAATWCYQLDGVTADGGQSILYIGIAADLGRRLKQHKRTKPWWREVCWISASLYASRRDAEAAEAEGIRCPVAPPRYNIVVPRLRAFEVDDNHPDFYRHVDLRACDV